MKQPSKQIIYGYHAVINLIRYNPSQIIELLLENKQKKRLQPIIDLAIKQKISIIYEPKTTLDELSGYQLHQGVVAFAKLPRPGTENDLQKMLDQTKTPRLLLVLDGVQDPHNLGACLRTANAAAVTAVIAPKDNAVGLSATVCKVASGAASLTPYVQVTNLSRTLRTLKEAGFWIYGADERGETTLYEHGYAGNIVMVLGAEGKGLRKLTKDNCDFLMSIPMQGVVSSLNVSVATGICLFEVVRQRKICNQSHP